MRILWRKTRRDLLNARWQALGLVLLVAIALGLLLGAVRARRMLEDSFETCLERLHAADLEIRCSPTLPGAIDAARDVPGIAAAEERMLLEGLLRMEGRPSTPARVQALREGARPGVFALEVVEGRWPRPGEEAVLVDRSLPAVRDVAVGDEVTVEILGARRTLPVVGVTLGSEHPLFPVHPDFDLPIPGTLAVLQMSPAAAAHFRYTDRVDSLLFRFTADADPEAVQDAVLERLGVAVAGILTPSGNPAQRVGRSAVETYRISMPTVVGVLLTIALSLYLITVARLVRTQRHQFGTLLCLGHRRTSIALSLLPMSLLPALVGGALAAWGHGDIASRIFTAHADSLGWAPLVDAGPGPEVAWALATALGVAVVGCLLPAGLTLRRRPAALMRPDTRRIEQSVGLLSGLGRRVVRALRLPLPVVLGLRTVVRRRWVSGVTAVALGANFALVLAFLFVNLSHTVESEVTLERLGLTGVVYFNEPQPVELLGAAAPSAWTRTEAVITKPVWFTFPEDPAFARLLCLPPDGWIRKFPIAEGRPVAAGEATVHVDYWLADEHGLAVGDRVRVYPHYASPEGLELEVAGIFGGVSLGFAVIPLDTGQALLSMPGMATGLHVESAQPREELVDALQSMPGAESVIHLEDARAHVAATFDGARFIITLTLVFAVCVAVVFLGILAALDATERARDLAVLRAIGWRDRTIFGLLVAEVTSRGIFALVLALPGAPWLATWMLVQLRAANHYRMPMHDPLWIYALVSALALVLIPLGAVPGMRAAKALPTSRIVRLLGAE